MLEITCALNMSSINILKSNSHFDVTVAGKNHLSDQDRSELLGLLRSVASAHDRETCEADISKLRDSVLYKTNTAVRNYVEKRWLVIKEVGVTAVSMKILYCHSGGYAFMYTDSKGRL